MTLNNLIRIPDSFFVLKTMEKENKRLIDIERETAITSSHIINIKKLFIMHGIIEIVEKRKDNKSIYLSITEKGTEFLKKYIELLDMLNIDYDLIMKKRMKMIRIK